MYLVHVNRECSYHFFQELYDKSMKGMTSKLVKRSVNDKLTYIAEMQNSRYIEKMDHLVSLFFLLNIVQNNTRVW